MNPESFRNSKQLLNIHRFVSENGTHVIAKMNSHDFPANTFKQILVGAVLSTRKGHPIRIHIICQNSIHVYTEKELKRAGKMGQRQFEEFTESISREMAYADYVVLLQKSKYTPGVRINAFEESTNPFKDFVDKEIGDKIIVNPRASEKPKQSAFGTFINELSSVDEL